MPSDPHTHLEMATVLEARGDIEGAVSHLGRALAAWEPADESFEPAREARAKLAALEGTRASRSHDGHVGLAGIRDGTELVGGSLNEQTSPAKGTTARVTVPIDSDGRQW